MARRSGTGSAGAGGGGGSRGGGSSGGGSSSGGSSSGGGSRGGSSGGSSSGGGGGSRGGGSASSSSSSSSARSSSPRSSSVTSKQSTGGTPAPKTTTVATVKRQTRTPTTLSAPAVFNSSSTTKATGRPAPRTVVKPTVTVSPPANRLTGGRIAQNPTTPKQTFSVGTPTGQLMAGTGTPVTITYAGGQKQTMALSNEAIKYYQNQGLKVSPVQQTFGGSNPMQTLYDYTGASVSGIATPQIPRIVNPSVAYDQNPPAQLHVTPNQVVKPKTSTRTNSAFGGLGANPWNPIDAITGLFDMSPQPPNADPASQWLPQQENNTQSQGYPTYTAMASGQYQQQAFADSPQGFNSTMLDPTQTVKNLFQNKYILYAGLAVGALITIKIVMGMFGGRGGSSGGTKIYT